MNGRGRGCSPGARDPATRPATPARAKSDLYSCRQKFPTARIKRFMRSGCPERNRTAMEGRIGQPTATSANHEGSPGRTVRKLEKARGQEVPRGRRIASKGIIPGERCRAETSRNEARSRTIHAEPSPAASSAMRASELRPATVPGLCPQVRAPIHPPRHAYPCHARVSRRNQRRDHRQRVRRARGFGE